MCQFFEQWDYLCRRRHLLDLTPETGGIHSEVGHRKQGAHSGINR
jgi:hypothetical protein